MRCTPKFPHRLRFRPFAVLLSAILAVPAWAYDYPLSSQAIRDAYFLGRQQAGMDPDLLVKYTLPIPELKVGSYISRVRMETPFLQVAERSGKALDYSAQDAVKEFYGKPAVFRLYLEICYQIDAPLPNSVKVTVIQNRKPVAALSDQRSAFFPASDVYTRVRSLGEKVRLRFDPAKFDSSTLTIRIQTPDGQDVSTDLDLQSLR